MTTRFGGILNTKVGKMREDHEELVLRNSAFCAGALWHVARSFADHADGRAPVLIHFVLAAGMLFHEATVEKIQGMRFDSGLLKAVSESPDIIAGLQDRVESSLLVALRGLQVGTASGILVREHDDGLPSFRATGVDLPIPARHIDWRTGATYAAAKRIGAWFAKDSLFTIYARLRVQF